MKISANGFCDKRFMRRLTDETNATQNVINPQIPTFTSNVIISLWAFVSLFPPNCFSIISEITGLLDACIAKQSGPTPNTFWSGVIVSKIRNPSRHVVERLLPHFSLKQNRLYSDNSPILPG